MIGAHDVRRRVLMSTLPAAQAVTSFAEVTLGYTPTEAMREAARAVDVDLTAAERACPFGVDVAALVRHTAAGDFDEALRTVMKVHPWPGVLGRWCHQPCAAAQPWGDREPVNIGGLERAAADHGDAARPAFRPGAATGRRVAILGAGSAGSATAYRLRQHGHAVTVFDQLPFGGGMKTIGFPDFRLPQSVVQRDNALREWGVELRFGVTFDRHMVRGYLAEYDAVVAATGKFKGIPLGIPGEDLTGVYDALDFLTRVKLDLPLVLGDRVAVVGAGYSAQDAARTLRRLGKHVRIYYRRSEEEMPVRPERRAKYLAEQRAEGVDYVFQVAPVQITGQDGRVSGVEFVRTVLGAPDASGRPAFVPVPNERVDVACDAVIAAVGERCDTSFLPDDVRTTDAGHVVIDPATFATSIQGLYAVGEMTGLPGTTAALRAGLACGGALDRILS